MLSDEERKAVDKIKILIQYLNVWKENFTIVSEDVKYLVTILNLIEKQQKEIEELKEEQAKRQWVHIKENGEVEPLFYVSKDKIKAKKEELKKECENCEFGKFLCKQCFTEKGIKILQSLLKEE